MSDPDKPELMVERCMLTGEWPTDLPPWPHCDARILHTPEECRYCAERTDLQEERVKLDVSNSGVANRKWPCPADVARGKAHYSAWHGNRATP